MNAPFFAISDDKMRLRPSTFTESHDLFRRHLENMIDPRHELFRLASILDWPRFDETFDALYCPGQGCPGKPMRGMVRLVEYLKQIYRLSDEMVVASWVGNPYWQYFCGEEYFQYYAPTDTTVQDKAVTFPTDGKRLNRSRVRLVKWCRRHGVGLRQSYARKEPKALLRENRYAHARQLLRMNRQVRCLRTYLGRVVRDIERKTAGRADLEPVFADNLAMARRLLAQEKKDRNKLVQPACTGATSSWVGWRWQGILMTGNC